MVSTALIVPTAYWVRLRLPRLRPVVEFVTLMPFVIPAVVLAFGLIRSFSNGPLPLAASQRGSDVLLVAAYTVLSLPYMYRAADTGLRTIDVRSLTEAGQSLGAGTFRILWSIILPNLRVAILSGAFLTLAIVIGEFTLANYLARPAFGPYLNAPRREQVLRAGGRRPDQLRPDVGRHGSHRPDRPRPPVGGAGPSRSEERTDVLPRARGRPEAVPGRGARGRGGLQPPGREGRVRLVPRARPAAARRPRCG